MPLRVVVVMYSTYKRKTSSKEGCLVAPLILSGILLSVLRAAGRLAEEDAGAVVILG